MFGVWSFGVFGVLVFCVCFVFIVERVLFGVRVFVVRCCLFVVCSVLVVGCSLLFVCCLFIVFVVSRLLLVVVVFVVCCLLLVVFGACCLRFDDLFCFVARCLWFVIYCAFACCVLCVLVSVGRCSLLVCCLFLRSCL